MTTRLAARKLISPQPAASWGPQDRGDLARWLSATPRRFTPRGPEPALDSSDPLRGIFERSPEWVTVLDEQGHVLFINATGRDTLEQEGRRWRPGVPWARIWRGEARRELSGAVRAALAGASARFTGFRTAPNGVITWWDVVLSPFGGADGRTKLLAVGRDITEHKRAEEDLQWAAEHDPLTFLPNRSSFQSRVEAEIAGAEVSMRSFGLLLLDLDDFKRVNDALGHDTGDALLCELAERLKAATRGEDFIARLGGDEFAIILKGFENDEQLSRATSAIQNRLKQPCILEGRALDCHASIGASIFPQHGSTKQELVKNADIALYSAKEAGRGTLRVFSPGIRSELQVRLSMLALAKDALANHRLAPFYQPKIDLRTGSLHGFEALLRWQHPTMGTQTPDTIQAAFEDHRLAIAISDHVINVVIGDMRQWIDMGVEFGHVAVNASAAEFRSGHFAERLLERLAAARIPPTRFQLEVTETVFLGPGAEYVDRALRTLSAEGVHIALDDFGTGYASLSHLKQFPVNSIKIDKSFIRDLHEDPDDEAIVRAVISLGQSLDIKVVAEGIETPAQSAYLRKHGCDYGQGFLFGHAEAGSALPFLVGTLARPFAPPTECQDIPRGGTKPLLNQRGSTDRPPGASDWSPTAAQSGTEEAGSVGSVYIIDDDHEVLASTRFLLETIGYRCRTFASGAAFLSAFLELDPGCLLLDMRMEGLNGHQVMSELRWMNVQWPIIIMSGHADDALFAEARAAGAQFVLPKPFDETVLQDILRRVLPIGEQSCPR